MLLALPQEIRDQIYREVLCTEEPLDMMLLLQVGDSTAKSSLRWPKTISLSILNTCHQLRGESLSALSKINTFSLYDDALPLLEESFADVEYQCLREPLGHHRLRMYQQTGSLSVHIRHLHISIASSAPDKRSSHRLSLRALLALAHEVDGKGFSGPQADQWRSSTAAYCSAAFLPPASQLQTITISISGFLHSESQDLLVEAVTRLYAFGNITFRFRFDGSREEDILFGRRVIDKGILEQRLSSKLGYTVVVTEHGFPGPRNPAKSWSSMVC